MARLGTWVVYPCLRASYCRRFLSTNTSEYEKGKKTVDEYISGDQDEYSRKSTFIFCNEMKYLLFDNDDDDLFFHNYEKLNTNEHIFTFVFHNNNNNNSNNINNNNNNNNNKGILKYLLVKFLSCSAKIFQRSGVNPTKLWFLRFSDFRY